MITCVAEIDLCAWVWLASGYDHTQQLLQTKPVPFECEFQLKMKGCALLVALVAVLSPLVCDAQQQRKPLSDIA